MSVSIGEHLVEIEIRELKRKMVSTGGKNLSPQEKIAEIYKALENLKRLHHQQNKDRFFSSEKFRKIIEGLEHILAETHILMQGRTSHERERS